MPDVWLSLDDIPAEGREFTFSDQETWRRYLAEFGGGAQPGSPVQADFTVLPREDGVLLRGRVKGSILCPCDRCTADVDVAVDEEFELFEENPEGEGDALVRLTGAHRELDVARMIWEQFSLNLPVKILCSRSCKGLCPVCGCDRNRQDCQCAAEAGDARMAALRGLKLKS